MFEAVNPHIQNWYYVDSWSHNPTHRLKDKADVIELIKARHLPRDLNVAASVRRHYVETWNALQAESRS